MGFIDGTANLDPFDDAAMDRHVWVQPEDDEPGWTARGTYHVVRVIRMFVEFWDRTRLSEQESIIGRRKESRGAAERRARDRPTRLLRRHRRGGDTARRPHPAGQPPHHRHRGDHLPVGAELLPGLPDRAGQLDQGLAFVSFQRRLSQFLNTQARLAGEPLQEYIVPEGGGFYFALPGVMDDGRVLGEDLFALSGSSGSGVWAADASTSHRIPGNERAGPGGRQGAGYYRARCPGSLDKAGEIVRIVLTSAEGLAARASGWTSCASRIRASSPDDVGAERPGNAVGLRRVGRRGRRAVGDSESFLRGGPDQRPRRYRTGAGDGRADAEPVSVRDAPASTSTMRDLRAVSCGRCTCNTMNEACERGGRWPRRREPSTRDRSLRDRAIRRKRSTNSGAAPSAMYRMGRRASASAPTCRPISSPRS